MPTPNFYRQYLDTNKDHKMSLVFEARKFEYNRKQKNQLKELLNLQKKNAMLGIHSYKKKHTYMTKDYLNDIEELLRDIRFNTG